MSCYEGTPCITDCVMAELEKLGQKYRVALRCAQFCCHTVLFNAFFGFICFITKKGFNLVFVLYPYSSSSTHAKCVYCIFLWLYLVLQVVFIFLYNLVYLSYRIAKDPRFQRLACTHKGTYADDCIVERVTQVKFDLLESFFFFVEFEEFIVKG